MIYDAFRVRYHLANTFQRLTLETNMCAGLTSLYTHDVGSTEDHAAIEQDIKYQWTGFSQGLRQIVVKCNLHLPVTEEFIDSLKPLVPVLVPCVQQMHIGCFVFIIIYYYE